MTSPTQQALLKDIAKALIGTGRNNSVEIHAREIRTAKALEKRGLVTLQEVHLTHGRATYGLPYHEAKMTPAGWTLYNTLVSM